MAPIKRETVEDVGVSMPNKWIAQEKSKVCFIQIVNASRRRFSNGAASFIALRYTKRYKKIYTLEDLNSDAFKRPIYLFKGNVTDKSIKRQPSCGGLSHFKCSSV